jgi:hypothetical protein
MGRPLSEMPEGMHFTHVAFAVYSNITLADGSNVPSMLSTIFIKKMIALISVI